MFNRHVESQTISLIWSFESKGKPSRYVEGHTILLFDPKEINHHSTIKCFATSCYAIEDINFVSMEAEGPLYTKASTEIYFELSESSSQSTPVVIIDLCFDEHF